MGAFSQSDVSCVENSIQDRRMVIVASSFREPVLNNRSSCLDRHPSSSFTNEFRRRNATISASCHWSMSWRSFCPDLIQRLPEVPCPGSLTFLVKYVRPTHGLTVLLVSTFRPYSRASAQTWNSRHCSRCRVPLPLPNPSAAQCPA